MVRLPAAVGTFGAGLFPFRKSLIFRPVKNRLAGWKKYTVMAVGNICHLDRVGLHLLYYREATDLKGCDEE
jgi:hypothetical protein